MTDAPRLSVVVPFKASDTNSFAELVAVWCTLANDHVEVVVCDGSAEHVFAQHAKLVRGPVVHVAVDRERYRRVNDKINGLCTGLRTARAEWVVVFDDDMYPDLGQLAGMCAELPVDRVHKLRTYVSPLTMLESIEVARALVSHGAKRMGDTSPVYFGSRPTLLRAIERVPGDVLFDDREIEIVLLREPSGLQVHPELVVCRNPSVSRKWAQQQIRYAYEDVSLIAKTGLFLALPTTVVTLLYADQVWPATALVATTSTVVTALAAMGWVRAGLERRYPVHVVFCAPVWFLVRTLAVPVALWLMLAGGVRHGGRRIRRPSRVRLWGW